jgi:hypothetical protein
MLLLYTVDAIKQCMALPRRSAGWGSRQQAYDLVCPSHDERAGQFLSLPLKRPDMYRYTIVRPVQKTEHTAVSSSAAVPTDWNTNGTRDPHHIYGTKLARLDSSRVVVDGCM